MTTLHSLISSKMLVPSGGGASLRLTIRGQEIKIQRTLRVLGLPRLRDSPLQGIECLTALLSISVE
jgi:hypothetical protein